MKSLKFNRNNAKGFSLIELLLVLGVLAILLVAAFVVYPQVRDRNQANAEVSNLTTIKANVNNLYASRGGNYEGLDTNVANQARVFPASMNNGDFSTGVDIAAAWGDLVEVEVDTTTTPANRFFTISYAGVPEGVCLGLVSGAAGNFTDVQVDGKTVMGTDGRLDPATAAAQCNTAAGGPVIFTSN